MAKFSRDYRENDEVDAGILPAGQSDIVALIQDHQAACINTAAPIEPDRDEAASQTLDPLNALRVVFTSLPSWSVSYRGVPYDDARLIDGIWWYSPIVGDSILRFPIQNHVRPLFENPPLKAYRRAF
jgi:hypothetical protein